MSSELQECVFVDMKKITHLLGDFCVCQTFSANLRENYLVITYFEEKTRSVDFPVKLFVKNSVFFFFFRLRTSDLNNIVSACILDNLIFMVMSLAEVVVLFDF